MSAIGPGDWVECVDARASFDPGLRPPPALTLGAIYRIAQLYVHPVSGRQTATLAGFPSFGAVANGGVHRGYYIERFRPIYRPKADFLESLLTPADAPSEREGVDA